MLHSLSITIAIVIGSCFAGYAAEGSQASTKSADAQPEKAQSAVKPAPALKNGKEATAAPNVRWTAAENSTWRWYRRETFVNGQWKLTGITLPVHRATGEYHRETAGYLQPGAVPHEVRRPISRQAVESDAVESDEPGRADPVRRARDGRPASKWLRSLDVEELRQWLPTIDVPEAGVEGMTYWEHLTRDHGFDPERIEGLTEEEEAKLHAAAHAGY